MNKLEKNLCKALENVGNTKGLDCINNEIYYKGRAIDDYLAVSVLSELIKDNKIEINLKTDKTDTRTEYFLRLLGIIRRNNG